MPPSPPLTSHLKDARLRFRRRRRNVISNRSRPVIDLGRRRSRSPPRDSRMPTSLRRHRIRSPIRLRIPPRSGYKSPGYNFEGNDTPATHEKKLRAEELAAQMEKLTVEEFGEEVDLLIEEGKGVSEAMGKLSLKIGDGEGRDGEEMSMDMDGKVAKTP